MDGGCRRWGFNQDPPGLGNGNSLQYCCLENSKDGGAWRATAHGIAEWTEHADTFSRTEAAGEGAAYGPLGSKNPGIWLWGWLVCSYPNKERVWGVNLFPSSLPPSFPISPLPLLTLPTDQTRLETRGLGLCRWASCLGREHSGGRRSLAASR